MSAAPHDDLFSFGGGGGSEEGYERWRAERAAERKAAAERLKAELLPQEGDESGYAMWREEEAEARKEFERRWGAPIGKRVRVELIDDSPPFEGVLLHVEQRHQGKRNQVRLRVGAKEFLSTQIRSLVRIG